MSACGSHGCGIEVFTLLNDISPRGIYPQKRRGWDPPNAARAHRSRTLLEHLKPLSDGLLADPEAGAAFHRLAKRAANEGFDLRAASAFRDYDRQAHIVNEKWLGHRAVGNDVGDVLQRKALSDSQWLEAILRFSALPGTSRHHWGTDMDIWDAAAVGDGYRLSLTAAEYGSGGI